MANIRKTVVICSDGKPRHFPSRIAAARFVGCDDGYLSKVISYSQEGKKYKGRALVLDIDDYSPCADYRFKEADEHSRRSAASRRWWKMKTPEERKVIGRKIAEKVKASWHKPGYRERNEQRRGYAVVNYTDGKTFKSVSGAAKFYGFPISSLNSALRKGQRCHGMHFGYLTNK